MAINLSNVNISLNEFQRLSQGEYNAGEVKLAGETKLAKMNNHVGSFFSNKDIISHEEVIAIKQALVKALSQNGVDADELARIRKDLGLASTDPADRDLRHRSIMPLTRQQIREILDRNAAKINDFNTNNHGSVYISKLSQLHQAGPAAKSAQVRDAVNAKLAEGNRQVNVNEDILHLQAIVSDSVDFVEGAAERARIVKLAKEQLAALLQSCNHNPSPEEPATATLDLPHGRTTSISTGMSQKVFAERLENIIVRFSNRSPLQSENDAVKYYQGLNDGLERETFLAGLANDPEGAFKARALAVRWLYSRGVTDYDTLALANRLGDNDALAFAAALFALPKDATPDQIRANPLLVSMAAKEPVRVQADKQAYIPATSAAERNVIARARSAGYFTEEIPMLVKAFTFVKEAKNLSDLDALVETLDPESQTRLLFSYGGKFIENAENFRRGFELMEKFRTWRESQYAAYLEHRRNTPTLLNIQPHVMASRIGLERFVMEEIAANPAIDIYEEDSEKLFGMEHNKAIRAVGFGYFDGNYGTFMGLTTAQREFLCDVLDVMNGPLPRTQAEKAAAGKILDYKSISIARILKNYDKLEKLREDGRFDRNHVTKILFGDLSLPTNATNEQIEAAMVARFEQFSDRFDPSGMLNLSFNMEAQLATSGDTFDACVRAFEKDRQLPVAPHLSDISPAIDEVNGYRGGRKTMVGDLHRPANSVRLSDESLRIEEANARYVFNFPDNTTLVSKTGSNNDPEVQAASEAIADKVAQFCGTVHDKQLAFVYYALSQSGAMQLKGNVFHKQGVSSTEHMALTYTLSKDAATGAITVTCSEPQGFKDKNDRPIHFHWTTTVAIDGTVTTTPLVIE